MAVAVYDGNDQWYIFISAGPPIGSMDMIARRSMGEVSANDVIEWARANRGELVTTERLAELTSYSTKVWRGYMQRGRIVDY